MGLNKVRLGQYLRVSNKNNNAEVYGSELIRGVTTAGILTLPKGSVSSVNLKPYKIVHRGAFVYNPSRFDLGSIAHCNEDLCIVSHLYIVFYLNDLGIQNINPEWLFLYLRRQEFYREIRFRNFGSQRAEFNFNKLSEIELPLPPIEVQDKYVAIYEAMRANQHSYESGLDDLKLACNAFIEKLMREISHEEIGPYIEQDDRRNVEGYGADAVRGLSIAKHLISTKANLDGVSLRNYKVIAPHELAYVPVTSRNGNKISIALNEDDCPYITSAINMVFKVRDEAKGALLPGYLMLFFNRPEFDRYARFNSWGSARETFDWDEMRHVRIPIPDIATQQYVVALYRVWRTRQRVNELLKERLKDICPILVKGSIEETRG